MNYDKDSFIELFISKLESSCGITIVDASLDDYYITLASIVKEQITYQWVRSNIRHRESQRKQVYYFSLEFLLGRMLESNIIALGMKETVDAALEELRINPRDLYDAELDPGLGNGGLGRLAACFMDSLASLGIPGHGCSIRYKYGLFEQKIIDGHQFELPDNWLRNENIWEIKKTNKSVDVKFGGSVREFDKDGRRYFELEDPEIVTAVPYDVPLVGYENGVVNNLRLWSAESKRQFNFEAFSSGDYLSAVSEKYSVEAISEVLYPDDSNYQNRLLRLKQQYFFVSAGIQSIIRHFMKYKGNIRELSEHISIHINDTHPAVAVPELMRILIDDYGLEWDEAWTITVNTISYTNHTIMPEALEKWPVDTFKSLLPRLYMIVHEINERFCGEVWDEYPNDWDRVTRMAIESGGEIHMAHLAIVGSHHVNGVAAVHSNILKNELFKDFYELYPGRFSNKTNGVTHRRWLIKSNPGLSGLITRSIGETWTRELPALHLLESEGFTESKDFLAELAEIKRSNKVNLAAFIARTNGINISPDSIFDVQVKRIHAYKRQLLMVMGILDTYYSLLDNPSLDIVPRTYIFSGKAAPSYLLAKETIGLISEVSNLVNNDKRIDDRLKVVFLENYRVSLAEIIIPAADVSEQISTASREASGTGNMKFMMNGAVTVGTLDGANIEISQAVGNDNFFSFGLTVAEVLEYYRIGNYNSRAVYDADPRISRIVSNIISSDLSRPDQSNYPNIIDSILTYNDEFFVLRDFAAYVDVQRKVNETYKDRELWLRMSAKNIANSGEFSSDEVIKQYATEIWENY